MQKKGNQKMIEVKAKVDCGDICTT